MATTEQNKDRKLTPAQIAQVERNRQKALLVRDAKQKRRQLKADSCHSQVKISRTIDTGAGFFIEEDETVQQETKITHPLGAVIQSGEEVDITICEDCGKEFMDSYLFTHFDAMVCDNCREENKGLITRTDAKDRYLLKDSDLDKREPVLKFILRKNPHNPRWGDMKLYYEPQVVKRMLEVWGSEEGLEEAKEKRVQAREKTKQKKFDQKLKELRVAVRSSLVKKDRGPHQHEYGDEEYNADTDMYHKKCRTCDHVMSYEKM